ncbi:MAG: glutamyl-tRNA amidotransferase [Christensenellaceae bacterium]|nr:glutamyl-tRNA amidotransferase [Christensenellaceae bacterium]
MSVTFPICSDCKHEEYLENEGKIVCKAFPDGIPLDFMFRKSPDEKEMCNNGVKFEKI